MLSVIGSLLIGLVVGFIARALKPGDDKLGWIMTALLGVAGSFVASYAGQALGFAFAGVGGGRVVSGVGHVGGAGRALAGPIRDGRGAPDTIDSFYSTHIFIEHGTQNLDVPDLRLDLR